MNRYFHVRFPDFGWEVHINRVAFQIGDFKCTGTV